MRIVLLVLALLIPSAGWAGAWSKGCVFTGGTLTGTIGTPASVDKHIGPNDVGCYRFNEADAAHFSSAAAHGSVLVRVTALEAVVVFDPQLDAEVTAATTALARPLLCTTATVLESANPERSCVSVGGAGSNLDLNGVEGPSGTQNSAVTVGSGVYVIRVTGACLAGDTCQVSFQGVGGGQR